MNRKLWNYLKFAVIPLLIILFCLLLYVLTDYISMGMIADWLDANFSYEYYDENYLGGTMISRFNWNSLKQFFLITVLVSVPVVSLPCILLSDYIARKIRSKTAHQAAAYLERYALQDVPIPAEFPPEYTEVFLRISEIRQEMQSQAQTLRTETERRNDLVTYLAHDLKTPLTSVIGYLTLLRDEPDISAGMRTRYTGIALKKAERMESLLGELFEITRFHLSHIELQMQTVSFSVMLSQLAHEFHPLLMEKHLCIEEDLQPGIMLLCDPDKMERVIDNLLRNAIAYSYPQSVIRLHLRQVQQHVVLKVTNSGRTIPPEQLARIFEQFFRLDAARSTTGGSGLGLAIARLLVEAHGGSISAESEEERICFTVTLPCHKIV